MCGNRVEELEQRVKELEASVEGLTDELVECKVRIRELENTVDEQSGFGDSAESTPVESETDPEATADAEVAEDAAESTASEGGDIIVPEADTPNTQAPDEADKTADPEAEAESESESEDDSGSDIIVA